MSRSKILLAIGVFLQTSTIIYWLAQTAFITGGHEIRQKGVSFMLRENGIVLVGLGVSLFFITMSFINYVSERIG